MTNENQETKAEKEKRAYERLAEEALEQLRGATDVTVDAISSAIDVASERLQDVGEFTGEQLGVAKMSIQLDLFALANNTERSAEFIQNRLNPGRVASGLLSAAGSLLEATSDAFDSWKDLVRQPLKRTTGHVTGPGTLTCTECKEEIEMEDTGRIPPCWKCHGTEFLKGY